MPLFAVNQRRVLLFAMPRHCAGRAGAPLLVALVLAMALLLRLALAVQDWRADAATNAAVVPAGNQVVAAEVDVAAVQALALFGDSTGAGAPAAFGEVAASGLDLQLEGVVVASRPEDSRAIIVVQGRQHSFRIGDALPTGVDVTLKAVAADQVIVGNGARDEVLRLYDGPRAARQQNPALPHVAAAIGSTAVDNGLVAVATAARGPDLQQRQQAAARLAEIIEVSPAAANGQLLGYRLAPGSRLKDFVQLGFKSGDVVTAINGIALGDVGNLPELYRLMNEAGDVSFSLLRDGQTLTLDMTLAP